MSPLRPAAGAGAGKGSYGSVFKARERASGQLVAVKVVPLSEGDDPADLAHEIELLAACDHPNVVRYLVRRPLSLQPQPRCSLAFGKGCCPAEHTWPGTD